MIRIPTVLDVLIDKFAAKRAFDESKVNRAADGRFGHKSGEMVKKSKGVDGLAKLREMAKAKAEAKKAEGAKGAKGKGDDERKAAEDWAEGKDFKPKPKKDEKPADKPAKKPAAKKAPAKAPAKAAQKPPGKPAPAKKPAAGAKGAGVYKPPKTPPKPSPAKAGAKPAPKGKGKPAAPKAAKGKKPPAKPPAAPKKPAKNPKGGGLEPAAKPGTNKNLWPYVATDKSAAGNLSAAGVTSALNPEASGGGDAGDLKSAAGAFTPKSLTDKIDAEKKRLTDSPAAAKPGKAPKAAAAAPVPQAAKPARAKVDNTGAGSIPATMRRIAVTGGGRKAQQAGGGGLLGKLRSFWDSIKKPQPGPLREPGESGVLGLVRGFARATMHMPNQWERTGARDRYTVLDVLRERFEKAKSETKERKWITLRGTGDGGGTPVQIDGSGNIVKGPSGLAAKGITNLKHFDKPKGGEAKGEKKRGESTDFDDLGATWRNAEKTAAAKKKFDALSDDDMVTVYHGTKDEHAKGLIESGEVNVPEGYKSDLPTMGTGSLYVAPTRADAAKYGKTVVAIQVRKGDLQPSPEALRSNPNATATQAFFNSFDGAVLPKGHKIKPEIVNAEGEKAAAKKPAKGDKPASKTPAKEPPSRASAKDQMSENVARSAADWEVDEDDLREAIDEIHEERSERLEARESAKEHLRKTLGITAGDVARMENAGFDHASDSEAFRERFPAVARRMGKADVFASELARDYPELELGDPETDDVVGNMFARIREGKKKIPPKHDADLIDEAASMVYKTYKWRRENAADLDPELAAVPFAMAFHAFREWYAKDAVGHEHGEDGRFVGPGDGGQAKGDDAEGEKASDEDAGDKPAKSKAKAAPIEKENLFLRRGDQLENLQLAMGHAKPVVGEKGAKRVADFLAKHEGGRVIAEMLKVRGVGGSTDGDTIDDYDSNGFAKRGNDAFQEAIDGKFTKPELDAAADWLQSTFNNSKPLGNVNQYRWLHGVAKGAKPAGGEGESKPAAASSHSPGDVVKIPGKGNMMDIEAKFFKGSKPGTVGIGWAGDKKAQQDIPAESASHFVNDLLGKVDVPANSGNKAIDAIASGEGEWLGKGNDGIVFAVGDKVAKVSTTVPFQPFNPGHVTPKEAAKRLEEQTKTNNMLADKGIPGILPQELVHHGDKAFAIREKLEIPSKLNDDQIAAVRKTLDGIHAAGYVVGDQIQVGLKDGKPYIYDLGNAQKARSKHDTDDDNSRFDSMVEELAEVKKPKPKKSLPWPAKKASSDSPASEGEGERKKSKSLFDDHEPTPEAKKAKGDFHDEPKRVQKKLLAGLDSLPGQMNLFDVDGTGSGGGKKSDKAKTLFSRLRNFAILNRERYART